MKFYSVTINGETYAGSGHSVKEIAERHGIPMSAVKIGVDLLRTPPAPITKEGKPAPMKWIELLPLLVKFAETGEL